MEVAPVIRIAAPASRTFLRRAGRHFADDAGIRQFLDIGTGLPTAGNTHEIAQGIAPECRVVYVDNDPVVLVHARALLTSDPAGVTSYIDADARDPDTIVSPARATLDFGQRAAACPGDPALRRGGQEAVNRQGAAAFIRTVRITVTASCRPA
jgi:S-adenosyl methyltransferase